MYTNAYSCPCDKSMVACVTCTYWGGNRKFDGLGTYYYNPDDKEGICNQIAWKGFSGCQVSALTQCSDYSPQHR